MVSFARFQEAIESIEFYSGKDRELMRLVGDGLGTYSCGLVNVVVALLRDSFEGDPDGWIEWWLWECDFGRSGCKYKERDSEEEISLADPYAFYSFLVELYHYGGSRESG